MEGVTKVSTNMNSINKLQLESAEQAILQCVIGNRILANEGLMDAFGHISVRNPENANTFFQSRSLSPHLVTKEDILEIDLDGNVVTTTDMKPYMERIIHASILKARPEVNAVYHGHPHSVIPFSITGVQIKPVFHSASMFFEGVPIYDDYDVSTGMLITSVEEGERLARVLGDKSQAVLLRGHGCCVVGKTVPQLVMASIYLRDNAELQHSALTMGQPKYLSYEEGRQAAKVHAEELVIQRAWGHWLMRLRKCIPEIFLTF